MNIRIHLDSTQESDKHVALLGDLRFELRHVVKEEVGARGSWTLEYYDLVDEDAARAAVQKALGVQDIEFQMPGQMPLYGEVPWSRLTVVLDVEGRPVHVRRG